MQGRSQDFSKGGGGGGGGGHTGSNNIVMAFSPRNIVGCLLIKGLQRGGHGHPRTPLSYALALWYVTVSVSVTVAKVNFIYFVTTKLFFSVKRGFVPNLIIVKIIFKQAGEVVSYSITRPGVRRDDISGISLTLRKIIYRQNSL